MLLDFNDMKEITLSGMNNGTGMITAKMYMDEQGKIISCSIHVGGSIGLHKHETSDDINYVLSGNGTGKELMTQSLKAIKEKMKCKKISILVDQAVDIL